MTINFPERIGTNLNTTAEAARPHAAASAAVRRAGFISIVGNADRQNHQNTVREDRAPASVRALGDAEVFREDRVRTAGYHVRRGPNPLFVAQLLAQDDAGEKTSTTVREASAKAYPSLLSDIDIFLPGEGHAFPGDTGRINFYA